MCFSASASFGAGVILSTIGIASLKQAKTSSQIPFASIPLIFAAQQITEGFLWLSLSEPVNSTLQTVTTYLFLFFAQVVWPVWVPFSVMKIEENKKRKRILKSFFVIGSLVSLYLAYCLLNFHVEGRIDNYHISYEQDYPASLSRYGGILYIMITIVPPFLSKLRKMNYLGLAILVSYIITTIFYEDYIVSVWCFFAAVISIVVYAILKE